MAEFLKASSAMRDSHRFAHTADLSLGLKHGVESEVMKVTTQFQSQGLSYAVANRAEFQDELEEEFGPGPSDGGELPLINIRNREGHKYSMQEEFTFPAIFFVAAGQKDQPRKYEGGREGNDFLKYQKEEATHPLVLGTAREDL
ncbi:protein disulfide-isomerase A3-like isoform X2 [Oncorhynchus kisutch]|nr:protein disulfide-isomerase A3-like isoform X2 [Oncorhynchus kisutch]XP_031642728.1 protein disulfide-isomerase A3-like isoform X2 [Oncorhynchus kisutch]XP_031642729.1 protein disulfide-isomerase A3-like isoform X2 [Oncorhynchus kisutch]XP_031642730.1 protein disulfide-isomerase A3-like isoform X2 [Oncorhynchus kisutch]